MEDKKKGNNQNFLNQVNPFQSLHGPPLGSLKVPEVLIILLHQILRVLILRGVLFWINIEALRIARVTNWGDDGPPMALVVDCVPVDAGEERVAFHLGRTARDVAQTSGAVDGAKLADDVLGGVADGGVLREYDGLFDDSEEGGRELAWKGKKESLSGVGWDILLVDLDRILVPEWRVAGEEFVDEDAQCPPVDRGGMALVMDHFWCEVLGGSTQCVSLDGMAGLVIPQSLGETKVDEFDVALAV